MVEHWHEATNLLEVLVMFANGQDDDGPDLMFTMGNHTITGDKRKKTPAAFKAAMEHADAVPKQEVTDIQKSLGKIFEKYIKQLEKAKGPWSAYVKQLTIIVLTDGLWQGTQSHNKSSVNEQIATFIRAVSDLTSNVIPRRVSIEFVQFGTDTEASGRLNFLDEHLARNAGIESVNPYISFFSSEL